MRYSKTILLLTFFNCYSLQSLHSPWYLNAIEKTAFSYQTKCQLIDLAHHIKNSSDLVQSFFSPKNAPLLTQIKKRIQTNFFNKEKRILQKLGTSLGFSESEWAECLQTISDIKNKAQELITDTPVYHDPSILKATLFLIKTLLRNNNIDPNTVNIFVQATDKPCTFAKTSVILTYTYDPTETPFIQQPRITYNIIIYKQTFSQPALHQLAMFAHEIEHMCLQHTITIAIIEQYAQHYLQKERCLLEHNDCFQQLKTIHEEQAEICAALKDAQIAQALVNLRSTKFYPHHLHEKHYYNLVEINNVWKLCNTTL